MKTVPKVQLADPKKKMPTWLSGDSGMLLPSLTKTKKTRAQAFLQSRMQEWKHLNTMSLTQLKKWIDGFGTTPNEANNFLRIQMGKYFDIYPNQRVAIAGAERALLQDTFTLRENGWVNDAIINLFCNVLRSSIVTKKQTKRRCGIFKSYFMNKVLDRFNDDVNKRFIYDYNAVKKWGAATLGKDTNPLDYDLIIFFNNDDDQHWNLIVLSPKDRVIEQLDSMSHGYHRNLEAVYKWFYDELSFHFPTSVREVFHNKQNEWKFYTGRFENLQKNSCNCGVFTIAWAIALVKGLNLKQVDQRSVTTTRMNLLSLITCHTGTQGVIKEPTYLSNDMETRDAENIILQATYLEEQVRIAVD
jgi:hypothetical protein